MKKIVFIVSCLLLSAMSFAQTDGINYQAVIINPEGQQVPGFDTSGDVVANKDIVVRFSILNEAQVVEYQETQVTTTDSYGLVNLVIGAGEPTSEKLFTELDWEGKPKNLYVEIDLNVGTGYSFLSLQKLTFVPHAFHRNIIGTGDMTIDGTSVFNGDVIVEGVTTLNNDIEITGDMTIGEDLNIIDDLNVGGRTYLGENLTVEGKTDMNGNLNVFNESNTNLTGALQVGGFTEIDDDLRVFQNTVVDQNLTVLGDQSNGGDITAVGAGTFGGDLSVGGTADVNQNLNVGGASDLTGALTVGGETNLLGRLNVQSITTIGGTLTVAEETFLEDGLIVTGDASVSNAQNVGGKLTVGQGMDITGTSNLTGALKVDGGNLTLLTGTLDVNDVANMNKGLNVTQATPTFLSGTLQVVKNAVFDDDVLIDGMLTVNNNLNLSNLVVSGGNGIEGNHIALFENTGESSSDGIAIRIASENLNSNNNFITFYGAGNDVAGRIESYDTAVDGESEIIQNHGTVYGSRGADYAEWLEKENPEESFKYGEVVGVKGGKISRNTLEADHILTISMAPIVLGNMPNEENIEAYEKVGFMGQVPTLVRGKVEIGDYIVASGLNDGMAKAVSSEEITLQDLKFVIGKAWTSSNKVDAKLINVSVGLKSTEWVTIMEQQEQRLKNVEAQVKRMQKMNEKLEKLEKRINNIDMN
ncbi:MAG: hypothetical protein HKN48_13135 [Flavobacteriaceae bacterium]|nr:hypothetical protein [Flavobacteriaceae bacterium]